MIVSFHKVISQLPSTLEPDSIYIVRVGDGFDHVVTNSVGSPFKVNGSKAKPLDIDATGAYIYLRYTDRITRYTVNTKQTGTYAASDTVAAWATRTTLSYT